MPFASAIQRMTRAACGAALALACTAAASAADAAEAVVTIGVLAPQGEAEAEQAWAGLGSHLAAALPGRRFVIRSFDLPSLRAAVAAGSVDFFIANSGFYVDMEAAHGASRIATLDSPQALSPGEAIASAVLVRAGRSDLQGWADLRRQRVVAVSEQAFGGWQVAWRELRRAGIEPQREFASLSFSGYPLQRVVEAVRSGQADAGVVRACLLEDLVQQGRLPAAELRVLAARGGAYACAHSTPLYPDWPFATLRHTPLELAKGVATALLTMPRTPDGHAWTVPTDYQPVRELFRELEIGPYADLRQRSLQRFVHEHWPWFALAGVLLLAWGVHSLRVERLVLARTAELRAALRERERMEQEARAQQDKLDHLSRLGILGEMASMLAHELNQPLTSIGNFAGGLARRIEAGRLEPAPLLEAAHEIAEQAGRAGGIMQRIRGFVGKRAVRRERIDLRDTVVASAALFASLLPNPPRTELRFEPAEGALWVMADRLQVEQVLLNLMKNALDAMQALEPSARRIALDVCADGALVRVAVTDNGAGVDPAHAQRLFEPFFTTKPDGVGLGLSICRRVVEALGGRIQAEPAPAAGLCVSFTLPRADDA